MNDDLGKKALGVVGTLTKQIGKTAAEEVKKTAKATVSQIGGIEQNKEGQGGSPGETGKDQAKQVSTQANQDIVKEMYAPSKPPEQKKEEPKNPSQQMAQSVAEKSPDKTPEEIQQIVDARQRLHKETYYDPLVNPPKQEEERPAEKLENEKEKERWELQEKEKKKPPPLAVDREQNKTEKFRGASG